MNIQKPAALVNFYNQAFLYLGTGQRITATKTLLCLIFLEIYPSTILLGTNYTLKSVTTVHSTFFFLLIQNGCERAYAPHFSCSEDFPDFFPKFDHKPNSNQHPALQYHINPTN